MLNDINVPGTALNDRQRTCQPIPHERKNIYMYNLRWSDTWPVGAKDLEFSVESLNRTPGWTGIVYANSGNILTP